MNKIGHSSLDDDDLFLMPSNSIDKTRNIFDPKTVSKLRKKRLREMTAEKFLQESTSEEEDDGAHTLRGLRNNRNARTVIKERKESKS